MTSQESVEFVTSLEPRAEVSSWPSIPWLKIWVQPHATIRAIVDSHTMRHVPLVAAHVGILNLLQQASNRSWGDMLSVFVMLLITFIDESVVGIVGVYISGALLRWTGSWFDGKATTDEVCAAVAWSALPNIAARVIWLPLLALYGAEMFSSVTPQDRKRDISPLHISP